MDKNQYQPPGRVSLLGPEKFSPHPPKTLSSIKSPSDPKLSQLIWNTYSKTFGSAGSTPKHIAIQVDTRLTEIIKEIQIHLGYQVTITGGRRDPNSKVNDTVGGADDTAHFRGLALDIDVPSEREKEVLDALSLFSDQLYASIHENPRHIHMQLLTDAVNGPIYGTAENFEPLSTSATGVYYSGKRVGVGPKKYTVVGGERISIQEGTNEEQSDAPGAFKIGCIWLTIPPTSIEVSEMNNIFQIPTVRTHGSPYTRDGRASLVIDFDCVFPNLQDANNKLRHILAQFRRSPFLPLENYFLQSVIFPEVKPAEQAPPIPYEPFQDITDTGETSYDAVQRTEKDAWLKRQKDLDESIATYSPGNVDSVIRQIEAKGRSSRETEQDFKRRLDLLKKIPQYLQKYSQITASLSGISFEDQQIVVSLRQVVVSTVPGYPGAIKAHFTCDLFNYLPYTNSFAYIADLDSGGIPHFNISRSNIFQKYYKGLLTHNGGTPEFNDSLPSINIKMEAMQGRSSRILLKYVLTTDEKNRALDSLASIAEYIDIAAKVNPQSKENLQVAQGLIDNIWTFLTNPIFSGWTKVTGDIYQGLIQYLGNFASTLPQTITSIQYVWKLKDRIFDEQPYAFLTNNPSGPNSILIARSKNSIPILQGLGDYLKELELEGGLGSIEELRALARNIAEYQFDKSILDTTFDSVTLGDETGEERSIITAISASQKPKVVPVSLEAFTTPTFQCFGGSEWIISLNIQTSSLSVVQKLRMMNERMNRLAIIKSKSDAFINLLYLDNTARVLEGEFLHFLGISKVMPGNFRYSTVEGKPGTYNISIDLVQTDVTISRYERLVSDAQFSNTVLAEVLKTISTSNNILNLLDKAYSAISNDLADPTFLQQWRSGERSWDGNEFAPISFRRWNKLIYNLAKPVSRLVVTDYDGESVFSYLMDKLSVDKYPNMNETDETSTRQDLGPENLTPSSPGSIKKAVRNSIEAIYITAAHLLIKELLIDALQNEEVPQLIAQELGPELLEKVRTSHRKFLESNSTYPDLDLSPLFVGQEALAPDFYYYKPDFFDIDTVENDANRFAEATELISQKMAIINGVNKYGAATIPDANIRRNFEVIDALETEQRLHLIADTIRQGTQVAKEDAEKVLNRLENGDVGWRANMQDSIAIETRKRFYEDKIKSLERQIGVLSFVTDSASKGDMAMAKNLCRSWGIITRDERQLNRQLLLDSISARTDKTLRMARAFPTFKLYFVEKDKEEWILFDDLYSYAAVKSIRVHESREHASSTAVIELSNISNVLNDIKTSAVESPLIGGAKEEQSVDRIMIRPGAEIMIRMGYSTDARDLDIVFQGSIVSVQPGEILTLTAQSWGASLLNPVSPGESTKIAENVSTIKEFGDLTTAIINEIPGMNKYGSSYNLAELVDLINPESAFNDIRSTWWTKVFNKAFKFANLGPAIDHRLDNIYLPYNSVPGIGISSLFMEVLGGKGLGFEWWIEANKSGWDCLHDVLRYFPGYIIKTLPYNAEDSTRARCTLYIGPEDGYYKATDDSEFVPSLIQNQFEKYLQRKRAWIAGITGKSFASTTELKEFLASQGFDFSKEVFNHAYQKMFTTVGTVPGTGYGYSVKFSNNDPVLYVEKLGDFVSDVVSNAGINTLFPLKPIVEGAASAAADYLNGTSTVPNKDAYRLDGKWLPVNEGFFLMTPTSAVRNYWAADYMPWFTAANVLSKWRSLNTRGYDARDFWQFIVTDVYDIIHFDEYKSYVDRQSWSVYGDRGAMKSQMYTITMDNPGDILKDGRIPHGYKRACDFHFADSYHHIVKNGIMATASFANKIVLTFPESEPRPDTSSLAQGGGDVRTIEVVVDDNISADLIRSKSIIDNNIDIDKANRYIEKLKALGKALSNVRLNENSPNDVLDNATSPDQTSFDSVLKEIPVEYLVANSYLTDELKKMYSGELSMLMNPKIRVHDTVYVHDDINEMYGPVKVREVTHIFDSEMGAFTNIVPDLCVYNQRHRGALQSVYASQIIGAAIKLSLVPVVPSLLIGAVSIGGTIPVAITGAALAAGGLYGSYKMIDNLLEGSYGNLLGRESGNFIPLWYRGAPFVAGVDGMRKDDFIVHIKDKVARLGDVWGSVGSVLDASPLFPET